MQHKKVDLLTINNGAALELFNEELSKVIRNINDVSVDSNETREIKMTVRIKPSKDRTAATTTVTVSSKLPSPSHESSVFITPTACYVNNPNQETFEFEQEKG